MIRSVEAAIQILLVFAEHDRELGVTELSEITGFSKSHVAKVLGVPELIEDPRFKDREDRKINREELKALLETVLVTRPAEEWERLFNEAGVPAGRVLNVSETVELEQLRQRDMFRTFDQVPGIDRPVTVSNGGFLIEEEGRGEIGPPPMLGQHNEDILTSLGVSAAEIAELKENKII